MSKDNGTFTKSLLESNKIFAEAAKVLQVQIDKVTTRLEGLEKDLHTARSQLKNKNLEILRLHEIIKSYETERDLKSSKSDEEVVKRILPQLQELSVSLNEMKATIKQENSSDSSEKEPSDRDFATLVQELESKNLEVQNLQLENNDLKEEERLLRSKIENLELSLNGSSQSKSDNDDDESLAGLKDEVSKYIKENISLQEKINSTEEVEKQLASLRIRLSELEQEAQVYQQTINYKEEREKELLAKVAKLEELEEDAQVYQQTINYKEEREKELLAKVAKLEELEEEAQVYQKTINYKEEREKELLLLIDNLQNNTVSLKTMINDLETESQLFQKTINYKEEREKELLAKIQTYESSSSSSADTENLFDQLNELKTQLHEKEEELINLKLRSNQLEQDGLHDLESSFDEQTLDLDNRYPEASDENELLLKISELEMEEANWQDEKKVLIKTVDNLKKSLQGSEASSFESDDQKDQLIKSLRNEVDELNQDIDQADLELKELEIENNVLRERISELENTHFEAPATSRAQINSAIEDNTQIEYELKEKESEIEELNTRLVSQEQKISHLTDLMDQERQLKEKFEFLFNNLKKKNEEREARAESSEINAKKELNQVLKSLNQDSRISEMSTGDTDFDEDESSSSDELGKALENANLYMSLIDKFLKPHVQITQLLKQGQWEINSLAEIIGLNRDQLIPVLKELAEKKILQYDQTKVWSVE